MTPPIPEGTKLNVSKRKLPTHPNLLSQQLKLLSQKMMASLSQKIWTSKIRTKSRWCHKMTQKSKKIKKWVQINLLSKTSNSWRLTQLPIERDLWLKESNSLRHMIARSLWKTMGAGKFKTSKPMLVMFWLTKIQRNLKREEIRNKCGILDKLQVVRTMISKVPYRVAKIELVWTLIFMIFMRLPHLKLPKQTTFFKPTRS